MFPIGIMYYFGTNLDKKFSVPDFWPSPNQLHKIPFEKDEINAEIDRLKARRLVMRERRLQSNGHEVERVEIQPDTRLPLHKNIAADTQLPSRSWNDCLSIWGGKKS